MCIAAIQREYYLKRHYLKQTNALLACEMKWINGTLLVEENIILCNTSLDAGRLRISKYFEFFLSKKKKKKSNSHLNSDSRCGGSRWTTRMNMRR